MKFVTTASIVLRSGKGGDGIIAWRREKRIRRGGPAGGSGGRGGSVYLESDQNMNSLFHVRHLKFLKAKNGENGRNKGQRGADAEDVVLKVPCGTKVFDNNTREFLHEFLVPSERYMACKGGEGGRGNLEFKSSRKPAPYLYELGDPYEEKEVLLDLQTISDVGILGKPNAGKSSLLASISNARPKVAPFPFTTIIPVLGSIEFRGRKLTFADVPGLIENASKGHGLGIEFLKHLNRCRIILHLVDVSLPDVLSEILEIEKELQEYSEYLFNKPRILALNKIDLITKEQLKSIQSKIRKSLGRDSFPISTIEKKGMEPLLERIFDQWDQESSAQTIEKPELLEINDPEGAFEPLKIERRDGVWIITHPKLEYWVYKIPRDTMDNVARLMQKCKALNVNQELMKLGAQKGDPIDICGWKYEF